jgi:hypothetical protein
MMLRALVVAAAVAAVAPSATAADRTGFAFGRLGGSIRPFTVSISVKGAVRAVGPVRTRATRVPRLELGQLNKLAATIGFPHFEKFTNCPGSNPDVASTFIRVGSQTPCGCTGRASPPTSASGASSRAPRVCGSPSRGSAARGGSRAGRRRRG